MVRGFLLNNQLTDFSFRSDHAGAPDANRVQPGKRPRSSMSPTLVFDDSAAVDSGTTRPSTMPGASLGARRLVLVLGSPGGASIISYVARTLVGTLDQGQSLQQVIDSPNIGSRNGPTEIEAGTSAEALMPYLSARGHRLRVGPMTSGLHGIIRMCAQDGTGCMLESGTDPRREGLAVGH